MQPILTRLAKPYNQTIITIIFINHDVSVAIGAIRNSAKSAETVCVLHDLPHPVPLNTAPVMLKMRSVVTLHLRHSGAGTSPSALMSRLIP
jgi:hypothetical protein